MEVFHSDSTESDLSDVNYEIIEDEEQNMEENVLVDVNTLGIQPYLYEPVNSSEEESENPGNLGVINSQNVDRLHNTNWYVNFFLLFFPQSPVVLLVLIFSVLEDFVYPRT
jgi:hypothetical protein